MARLQRLSLSPEDAGKGGAAADAAAKAGGDAAAAKAGADGAAAAGAKAGEASTDASAKAAADAAAAKGNEAKAEKKAPESYDLKLPKDTTLDEADLDTIKAIAKENNWTNDEAQAVLEQHHETLQQQSARFLEATQADPTYGGKNLDQSRARAKAVIDKVRPANHPRRAAFEALLNKSGYGNHVEIVSFLADLGALTEEDAGATGDGTAGAKPKNAGEVLYGTK